MREGQPIREKAWDQRFSDRPRWKSPPAFGGNHFPGPYRGEGRREALEACGGSSQEAGGVGYFGNAALWYLLQGPRETHSEELDKFGLPRSSTAQEQRPSHGEARTFRHQRPQGGVSEQVSPSNRHAVRLLSLGGRPVHRRERFEQHLVANQGLALGDRGLLKPSQRVAESGQCTCRVCKTFGPASSAQKKAAGGRNSELGARLGRFDFRWRTLGGQTPRLQGQTLEGARWLSCSQSTATLGR